jgi:hypothetical protein
MEDDEYIKALAATAALRDNEDCRAYADAFTEGLIKLGEIQAYERLDMDDLAEVAIAELDLIRRNAEILGAIAGLETL